jgi:hypothetical protein
MQLNQVTALDFHVTQQKIYWFDQQTGLMYESYFDGKTGIRVLDNLVFGKVEAIAVDWISDIIMWTDSVYKTLNACTLKGLQQTVIRQLSKPPTQLLFSGNDGFVFWVESSSNLKRMLLTSVPQKEELVIKLAGFINIRDVAIDRKNKILYIVNDASSEIKSYTYTGSYITEYNTPGSLWPQSLDFISYEAVSI